MVETQNNDSQRPVNGTALAGAAVFDQDIYGGGDDRFSGYERSIGTGEEDDERSQAVQRSELLEIQSYTKCFPCFHTSGS